MSNDIKICPCCGEQITRVGPMTYECGNPLCSVVLQIRPVVGVVFGESPKVATNIRDFLTKDG